jgi:hypothetical protein
VPRVQIPVSPPLKNLPGPAQRGGYEPRQIRKKAAAVTNPCAAGSLAFLNIELRMKYLKSKMEINNASTK